MRIQIHDRGASKVRVRRAWLRHYTPANAHAAQEGTHEIRTLAAGIGARRLRWLERAGRCFTPVWGTDHTTCGRARDANRDADRDDARKRDADGAEPHPAAKGSVSTRYAAAGHRVEVAARDQRW